MAHNPADRPRAQAEVPRRTFLTHHAQVLLGVAADRTCRVADIATRVGISERATLTILADGARVTGSRATARCATLSIAATRSTSSSRC